MAILEDSSKKVATWIASDPYSRPRDRLPARPLWPSVNDVFVNFHEILKIIYERYYEKEMIER